MTSSVNFGAQTSRTLRVPVAAVWNDGKRAVGHPVLLNVASTPRRLVILSPEGLELSRWNLEQVRVLSLPAEVPLRLAKEAEEEGKTANAAYGGERLTVADSAAVHALMECIAQDLAPIKQKNKRRWIVASLAAWLFCLVFYFGSPLLFQAAATLIPRSWEESMGESFRESVVDMLVLMPGTKGVCQLSEGREDLEQLSNRLAQAMDSGGYSFDILVLDSSIVNAFALPGGYLVVTTGLIKDCASPDELAGVLAHEMVHVTERHGTSRMLREQSWQLLGSFAGGSEYAAVMRDLLLAVVGSGFDRDQEREADIQGARRMIAAGVNPAALANFFARLQKEETPSVYTGALSYLASHPDSSEREKYLRKTAAQQAGSYTPALNAAAWSRLQGALCTK